MVWKGKVVAARSNALGRNACRVPCIVIVGITQRPASRPGFFAPPLLLEKEYPIPNEWEGG